MSKTKKNVLRILLIVFAVLVIGETVFLFCLTKWLQGKFFDPYETYPALIPPDTYVKIEDVEYIRYDGVFPDPEKAADGGIENYQESELEARQAQ